MGIDNAVLIYEQSQSRAINGRTPYMTGKHINTTPFAYSPGHHSLPVNFFSLASLHSPNFSTLIDKIFQKLWPQSDTLPGIVNRAFKAIPTNQSKAKTLPVRIKSLTLLWNTEVKNSYIIYASFLTRSYVSNISRNNGKPPR